jgi:hypothetical protein
LEGDTDAGYFTFLKPTKGWPAGKYHLDIYASDELATTVKFTIEGAKQTETQSKQSAGGDVKVTVEMAADPKGKSMTTFPADTPKVFARLKITGGKRA